MSNEAPQPSHQSRFGSSPQQLMSDASEASTPSSNPPQSPPPSLLGNRLTLPHISADTKVLIKNTFISFGSSSNLVDENKRLRAESCDGVLLGSQPSKFQFEAINLEGMPLSQVALRPISKLSSGVGDQKEYYPYDSKPEETEFLEATLQLKKKDLLFNPPHQMAESSLLPYFKLSATTPPPRIEMSSSASTTDDGVHTSETPAGGVSPHTHNQQGGGSFLLLDEMGGPPLSALSADYARSTVKMEDFDVFLEEGYTKSTYTPIFDDSELEGGMGSQTTTAEEGKEVEAEFQAPQGLDNLEGILINQSPPSGSEKSFASSGPSVDSAGTKTTPITDPPPLLDIPPSDLPNCNEGRTTVMLRNIPNKYTQPMLMEVMNKEFRGLYDFFYLPIDFRNKCNVGYAFINFIHPYYAELFRSKFNQYKLSAFKSSKVCTVTWGRVQGLNANIEHYRNSAVMSVNVPHYKPMLFKNGMAISWPSSDGPLRSIRPRPQKC